jgi:hypothetical protein
VPAIPRNNNALSIGYQVNHENSSGKDRHSGKPSLMLGVMFDLTSRLLTAVQQHP